MSAPVAFWRKRDSDFGPYRLAARFAATFGR